MTIDFIKKIIKRQEEYIKKIIKRQEEYIKKIIKRQEEYIKKIEEGDYIQKELKLKNANSIKQFYENKLKEFELYSRDHLTSFEFTTPYIELVKEFHDLFEQPIGIDQYHIEPLHIRQFRIKLLFEELKELAQASDVMGTFFNLCNKNIEESLLLVEEFKGVSDGDNVNKVEELDAITDLQYVLDGKKLTSGLYIVTDKAFELIHENNMSKAHKDLDHLLESVKQLKLGDDFSYKEKGGKYFLYNKDGKLTKPFDHTKVDLSILFNNENI